MPSNGLCGFSCIAYSVTGHRYAYTDVINDSFRARFTNTGQIAGLLNSGYF